MDLGVYRYSFLNRGGDRVVIDYANYLAAQGHRITFHTCVMRTVFSLHPAITINLLSARNEISFLLYPLWHRLAHDVLLFDIIHCTPFLSPHHRKSIVYFAQADDREYYANPFARAIIDLIYRSFFKKNLPTITVSEPLTTAFSKRYNATDCHTVTNGIDLQTFYPEPDQELLRAKGPCKAIFFMSRGDHYRKGFDIAMTVFREISAETAQHMELWVCGDSLPEVSFPFPVRQFGVIDDARLRQLLSSADIFFYPSRHEGFGLFPLEAMACGCPVVTTEAIPYAQATPAILSAPIEDTVTLGDHIHTLVHDNHLRNQLRTLSLATAKEYDMQISSKRFATILLEIIKKKQTERGSQ